MSRFFFTFFISLLWLIPVLGSAASAQWTKLADCGSPVACVYFLNEVGIPSMGFAGAANGIWRTSDLGLSWSHVSSLPVDLSQFVFKDGQTGWCSSRESRGCFKTIDGGLTWTRLTLDHRGEGIAYNVAANLLFVASWDGYYCVSNDEGSSWNSTPLADFGPCGFSFGTAVNGVMTGSNSGGNPPSYFTTDGGFNWSLSVNMQYECWQPRMVKNSKVCFAFSEIGGGLNHSTDGGINWTSIPTKFLSTRDISTAILGDIKGDLCRLYVQSGGGDDQNVLPGGIWLSRTGGRLWHFIGGPWNEIVFRDARPRSADRRFWVSDRTIYAGDTLGGVWSFTDTATLSDDVRITMDSDHVDFDTLGRCENRTITLRFASDLNCDTIRVIGMNWDIADPSIAVASASTSARGLAPGQGDSIVVSYAPISDGKASNALLRMKLLLGGVEHDTLIRVMGVSAKSPRAKLSTYSIDFDTISICDSSSRRFVLSNPSCDSVQVTLLSAPGAGFKLGSSWQPTALPGGFTDTLSVTFHSSTTGKQFSFVQFHCVPRVGQSYDLTLSLNAFVIGGAPSILLSDSSLNLGQMSLCSSATATLHFKSTGCDSLEVTGEYLTGSAGFSLLDQHPATLPPGLSDSVHIKFSPTAIGAFADDLLVRSNAGPRKVHLTASVVPGATQLSVDPISLDFGTLTAACDTGVRTVMIRNFGCAITDTIRIDSVRSSSFDFSTSTSTKSIAHDSSAQVLLTFAPSQAANYSTTIRIWYHGADGLRHDTTVAIMGIAKKSALISMELGAGVLTAPPMGSVTIPIYLSGNLDRVAALATGLRSVTLDLQLNSDLLSPASLIGCRV